jgi:hypothetical protein
VVAMHKTGREKTCCLDHVKTDTTYNGQSGTKLQEDTNSG